jgi:hypothetical protein
MKHATTRMLFAYWDGLRGERAAPERSEIEPGAIRHLLADTFVLEIEADADATIRLAGTRVCAFFGRELKGASFPALWGASGEAEPRRFVETVTDDAAALVAGLIGATAEQERVDLELVLLPLRHRGKTHARVLGALSPRAMPSWIGLRALVGLTTVSLRVICPSGHPAKPVVEPAPATRRVHLVVHQGGRAKPGRSLINR